MLNKQELITIQKKYSKYHYTLLVLIVLFSIIHIANSGNDSSHAKYGTIVVCIAFLFEFIFGLFDYFKKPFMIYLLKLIELYSVAFVCMSVDKENFIYVVYSAIYILLSIELSLYFDIADFSKRLEHTLICVFPLFFFGTINVFITKTFNYGISAVFILFVLSVVIFSIFTVLGEKIEELNDALLSKDRLLDKAYDNNKNIIDKQQKLFYVNEQLGIKKIEVEAANQKIKHNSKEMELQNKLMEFYTSTFDVEKIKNYFAENIISTFSVPYIYLYDVSRPMQSKLYGDSKDSEFETHIREDIIEGKDLSVLRSIDVFSSLDVMDYTWLEDARMYSCAKKGIYVGNELKYVCVLFSDTSDYFKDNCTYYDNLLNELQVVINNTFIYQLYYDLSKKDGLTGTFNRRNLNEVIEIYKNSGLPVGTKLAVAMFDIDNFKKINDTYGHLFGDEVIKQVAHTIRDISNELQGQTYRYGGEEFVAMFKDENFKDVVTKIIKIHNAIKNTPVEADGISLNVDVSIGLSAYPDTNTDFMQLVELSDKAMYYSKTHGKGRITVDGTYISE